MHHKTWLTLISILLLGVAGGTVTVNQPVRAARKRVVRIYRRRPWHRYYHVARRSRQIQRMKKFAVSKIPNGVYPENLLYYTRNGKVGFSRFYFNHPRFQTKMTKNYINTVIKDEYQDINNARHSIKEQRVVRNHTLDQLAAWRAQQAHQHFTHYNRKGQPLAWLDAQKMRLGSYRYNRKNIGENMFDVGKLSQVRTNVGVAGYYFKDPSAMAGDNVYDSLNNDAASQWAHGENIMMPQHRYVGIGTYYQKSNQTLYVLVEFSSQRPVTHKK